MVNFNGTSWSLGILPLDIFSRLPIGSTFSNQPDITLDYKKISSYKFICGSSIREKLLIKEHAQFFLFVITAIPGYPQAYVTIGKQTYQGTKLKKLTYNLSKRKN